VQILKDYYNRAYHIRDKAVADNADLLGCFTTAGSYK